MNAKKQLIWSGILFLLVGIIFIVAAVIIMLQGDSLQKRCTEQTTGTVVDVICESNYNTSHNEVKHTYYPVIEYKVDDRTITQRSNIGQNPPKYKVGQQVEICYNPNNVAEFIIKGDSTSLYIAIGFIALGSVAVAVGYFAFIRKLRNLGTTEV